MRRIEAFHRAAGGGEAWVYVALCSGVPLYAVEHTQIFKRYFFVFFGIVNRFTTAALDGAG